MPLGQSLDGRAGDRVAGEGGEDVELDTRVVGLLTCVSSALVCQSGEGHIDLTV